jgi:hypothetical protein
MTIAVSGAVLFGDSMVSVLAIGSAFGQGKEQHHAVATKDASTESPTEMRKLLLGLLPSV